MNWESLKDFWNRHLEFIASMVILAFAIFIWRPIRNRSKKVRAGEDKTSNPAWKEVSGRNKVWLSFAIIAAFLLLGILTVSLLPMVSPGEIFATMIFSGVIAIIVIYARSVD